ncbi:FMN-binding glutamate synthase family protein [Bacillus benzoevorans]|uniref:Glutamate synthase domain-containing protein 2 n=1 Tax=Bacillus benzoevorans TaxID=1456 RepID=A0A7X0HSP4_9BACI|nr:FMN-binding glutamate synthase family protein [Bacillus benzoevorans]MBB6446154.1 glutamate synthase domain-containing protein 2 [Bacillus benzoevorans]
MQTILLFLNLAMLLIIVVMALSIVIGWRSIMKKIVMKFGKIILTDNYQENIMELMPGLRHVGIQNMLENSLRAQIGTVLYRPLGSSKKWPHLDPITFIPAQTSPFPVAGDEPVDMAVTIGPKAKKPMQIDIPLIVSGMGYGVGLSEQARMSLAQATKNVGTAINSGEGGILPEELKAAGKYILQFSRTEWSKQEQEIKRADMIEIKLGQGAVCGMGKVIPPKDLQGRARELMGLEENENAVIYEQFFENQTFEDLKELVIELRKITGGVPIGAKMGAGGKIEEDIDRLIELGVDFISIDGGQAAMKEAPPILADDFGIPTLHAVVRTVNHLEKRKLREQISLIVSGGLLVPGHFLKVLALGADAVNIGSAMLFALTHTQSLKAVPFEPPTQTVWYNGKLKDLFNMEDGAQSAEKFLTASVEEMKLGLRAMGKRSLKELSKQDLVSYDELTAKMTGIPYTFNAWDSGSQNEDKSAQNEKTQQNGKSRELEKSQ